MGLIGWLFSGALAVADVLALVFLVRGVRASGATVGRWRRAAAWTFAMAVLATVVITSALAVDTYLGVRGDDVSTRATNLARGISEMLNCAVAGSVLSVVPGVAWLVLAVRSRDARDRG